MKYFKATKRIYIYCRYGFRTHDEIVYIINNNKFLRNRKEKKASNVSAVNAASFRCHKSLNVSGKFER